MRIRKTIFGRSKIKPNTFIGGVGSTINTPALLAAKLNVNLTNIKSFNIIDNNVECAILVPYTPRPFSENTQMTYYEDKDGLVKLFAGNGFYPFRGCTSLKYVKMPNLEVLGPSAFGGCINLEFLEMPNLLSIDSYNTNDGIRVFQNCNKLTTLNFPKLTRFYSNSALYGLTSITLVNIPKCTVLGKTTTDNSVFFNIKTGCTININSTMATINGGVPDGDLQYAITSRGAIINYIP